MRIKVLEQITIENKYSRKDIRQHVLDAIEEIDEGKVASMIDIGCEAIQKYLDTDYSYASKNVRVAHVIDLMDHIDLNDIVLEILCIILPKKGPQTIQGICGQLAGILGFDNIFDGIKTAAELVTVVCESNLYDIILPRDSETGTLMVEANVSLPEEIHQYIANTKYLPPMICEPQYIKDNWTSGYLTKNESVILKGKGHDEDLPLDVLNRANRVALSLEPNILAMQEKPKNELDTPEKVVNFARMSTSSRTVYNDLMNQGNKFYLNHKFDERLRMYCQGYHCSYQSTEYKKALINLHKKELIT